jgi:penicillin-binding protein 2
MSIELGGERIRFAPREVPPELAARIAAMVGIVLVAFTLIVARLWFLQVVLGPKMRMESESNRTRLVRVPSARGVVYDRRGEILIDNRPSFDVVFVPEDAGPPAERKATLRRLATLLGETESQLHERLRAPSKRPAYEGIVVRRDLEWNDVVRIETHQLELPGVSLQVVPRRTYPFGPLAAHLFGYVGEVSERELQNLDATTVRAGDVVGKASLEKAWDVELRGVAGEQQVEVDALGRRMRVLDETSDISGDTLTLTIDRELQDVAEQALGERNGAIVAIDPRNGEILAMVSHPSYDPNLFARGLGREESRALMQNPAKPLVNRAVQGQFAPGSTFKVAVAAGALEAGVATRSSGVSCGGGTQFGNHFFRCWRKGGHGHVDLHEAIVQSCDVFFYTYGPRLGIDALAKYVRSLGLGLLTGVQLDHEKSGTIPDSEWKMRRFKQPWYPGETLSVAIGQGYVTATPLQMANLAATIANGGTRYRPHYVRRVDAPDGSVRKIVEPEVVGHSEVSAANLEIVREAMRDVVMSDRGTGKKARIPGVTVAGKTGTAQVVKMGERERSNKGARATRDHAWFISFAPYENPEIAVACIVENAGGGGGAIAAPTVRQVLAHYFNPGTSAAPEPAAPLPAVGPRED